MGCRQKLRSLIGAKSPRLLPPFAGVPSTPSPSPPIKVSALFAAVSALCLVGFANTGTPTSEIVLGQSCALTGPAGALGNGMRDGLQAAFAEYGEINGNTIKLITMDDGYEPNRAIENTRKLLDENKVFMLIGEVGTPTSKAVVPVAEEAGVPFFGPFTGAEFLRGQERNLIVNVRGSYYQEMERLAKYLVDEKGLTKIACFYQNDGYGQAGLSGIELALERRGMELAGTGTYERNTVAVKSGLLQIRKASPEAVIMVGAYKPCAEMIKLAKRSGMKDTVFCNISFVGTKALLSELGEAGEGCIISQVVNFPWDESVPLVKEYQASMKKHLPEASTGFVSLEGYMVGKLFCEALSKTEGEVTPAAVLSTINRVSKWDLGGVHMEFTETDRQGMDEVFLTVIKGGEIQPLN